MANCKDRLRIVGKSEKGKYLLGRIEKIGRWKAAGNQTSKNEVLVHKKGHREDPQEKEDNAF